MFWYGVAENLVSDIIFILFSAFLAWCIFQFTNRTKLLRFFDISKSKKIAIYLSELKLSEGDASGIDGDNYSYTGSAVAFGEMQLANKFRDLFNRFLPSLSDSPNFLMDKPFRIRIISKWQSENSYSVKQSGKTYGKPTVTVKK